MKNFLNSNNANFREIRMGSIKPGILYRSGHPVPFADKQDKDIAKSAVYAGIATVLNLVDTKSRLKRKAFFAPWYHKLYSRNRIIAMGMAFDITGKNFMTKLKQGIRFMLAHDGPYLVHCYAGIDRTGFVSALLEALMGANLDEITEDYLLSLKVDNSYGKGSSQYKKDSLVILGNLNKMNNGVEVTDSNIQKAAENYLALKIRLSTNEINALKIKLSV